MLTGMNDDRNSPVLFFQRMVKRSDFHKIRPGRSDEVDEHVRWDRLGCLGRWDRKYLSNPSVIIMVFVACSFLDAGCLILGAGKWVA